MFSNVAGAARRGAGQARLFLLADHAQLRLGCLQLLRQLEYLAVLRGKQFLLLRSRGDGACVLVARGFLCRAELHLPHALRESETALSLLSRLRSRGDCHDHDGLAVPTKRVLQEVRELGVAIRHVLGLLC